MTERERFRAVLHFEEVDVVPNVEIGYWKETFARWQKEGLPPEIPELPDGNDMRYTRHSRELTEYFQLEAHDVAFGVSILKKQDPPPTFEKIAEDEDTETVRFSDGRVIRWMKTNEGIYQEFEWPVKTREDWDRIRPTIKPGWDNVGISLRDSANPESLPPNDRDFAAELHGEGFFMMLRYLMGFERACTVFYEDPGFAFDILNFWCDYLISQCELVLEHLEPEIVMFSEDMAYNHGSMLSPSILKEFLQPCYKRVVSVLNAKKIDVVGIDSDGFPDEMIPILYEAGVNLWAPFEMVCRLGKDDLLSLGKKYPWLRMFGGIDKLALAKNKQSIDREIEKIPPLIRRGGYIPTIDHKVAPEASLEMYQYYLEEKAKALIRGV